MNDEIPRRSTRKEIRMDPIITPKALAAELNIDPKTLRGWLRKNHTRALEAKNTSWSIPADVADQARERWAAKDEAATDPANVEA